MDVPRFLRRSGARIRADGLRGVSFTTSRIALKGLQVVDRFTRPGDPIYADEWDLLIVLDACRYDLMEEVIDDYAFLSALESRYSMNSVTRLWMTENFTDEYRDRMAETHYVSGNPFSRDLLDEEAFAGLTEVWTYAWVDPGTVPPRAVTDATIRAGRETDADRIVAHYMQPHCPFIPAPEICGTKEVDRFGNPPDGDVWDRVQRGAVDRAEAWDGYRRNLELVLRDVELLLENVDAERVVVTSDHGNAFGEWGLYGHLPNTPLPCMREVPWIETTAVDERTHHPDTERSDIEVDRKEQLGALGYL